MKWILVFLAVVALLGCDGKATSETGVDGMSRVYTVEHDGHRFVVARAVEAISILHHPDCTCLKKGAER